MKIKIENTEKNRKAIMQALDEINGKAQKHTATFAEVLETAMDAEERLEEMEIPKKNRIGARVEHDSGTEVSNRYKYIRITNRICIERGSADWFLVSIEKREIRPDTKPLNRLLLTDEQEKIFVGKIMNKAMNLNASF